MFKKKEKYPPQSLFETAKKANALETVSTWLAKPGNAELASKNWTYFEVFVHHAGENKVADAVFNEWLSTKEYVQEASKSWEGVRHVIDHSGKHKITKSVFGWLKKLENTRYTAKDWRGFSALVLNAGMEKRAEQVFEIFLASPEDIKKASKEWNAYTKRIF